MKIQRIGSRPSARSPEDWFSGTLRIDRRLLVGPIGYGLATMVALFLPWLALVFCVLLNLFYLRTRKGAHREVVGRIPSA